MTKFLIYLFPALMDMALMTVIFVATRRLAEGGASAMVATAAPAVWAGAYMIFCPIVGRLVTPRNAAWMLVGSGLVLSALGGACILLPQTGAIFLLMIALAATAAGFFVPFQVFMKAVEQDRPEGVVRSTAIYTFSWSMGIAAGPFVSGYVWTRYSWQWCHAIEIVVGLAIAIGIVLLRHHARKQPAAPGVPSQPVANRYKDLPDLAWLGWIAGGVGCLSVSMVRALLPATGTISREEAGTVIAIFSAVQAIVGLCFLKGRYWMYKPGPVGILGAMGVAGLALFAWTQQTTGLYLAAACYGVYCGGIFFYLVFHSLVHPQRHVRYVSINESIVGLTGVVGPLAGGFIADHQGFSMPYVACAIAVLAGVALQVIVHGLLVPVRPRE